MRSWRCSTGISNNPSRLALALLGLLVGLGAQAQCLRLRGHLLDADTHQPVAGKLVLFDAQNRKLAESTVASSGSFRLNIACETRTLVVEAAGYRRLRLPVYLPRFLSGNPEFAGALTILPVDKLRSDEPYFQSEQRPVVLRGGAGSVQRAILRVVDADSHRPIGAEVCLFFTKNQRRECVPVSRSPVRVLLPVPDVVAIEARAEGYQPYLGNLMMMRAAARPRVHTLRLSRTPAWLALADPGPGAVLHRLGDSLPVRTALSTTPGFLRLEPGRYVLRSPGASDTLTVRPGLTFRPRAEPLPTAREWGKPPPVSPGLHRVLYFSQSSYLLRDDARRQLDTLLRCLAEYPRLRLNLVGHTDNAGDHRLNQYLSEFRATVVGNYLTRHGLGAHRLTVIGLAARQPAVPNADEATRRLNRRVEVWVLEP